MASVVPRLPESVYAEADRRLAEPDQQTAARYPGGTGARQPVHTAYVPADRFQPGLVRRWGDEAAAALDELLPTDQKLADLLHIPASLAEEVRPLVTAKLQTEPIEDLRIDFEDGYGAHPDTDEDAAAVDAAAGLAAELAAGQAPPYAGLRFKSLEPQTRRRGVRTLDLFLGGLMQDGGLPAGLIITLPKVTHLAQVEAFVQICTGLEQTHGLPEGRLRFEIQVETPQAIVAVDGRAPVAQMIRAGAGRVTGLHYGTYDYSAALGVSAAYQSLEHPVADYAKAVMQVAAAGTGVQVCDGSTNILPIGTPEDILSAWRLHARLVRRSLERAFYQGWDLHPLQLVTRYAATYAFYRAGMATAADRLRTYLTRSASGVLDEPATAQAMASFLVRGLHSGALQEDEVQQRTDVPRADLEALYRRRVG